ncbi:hypothetical protein [Rhodoferax sp. BLA1]|uniref:hypothetical protein n=1 Tax=Rhodoferax sp. BLA1 TaxID=2576062 RepID=UPI00351B968B
MRYLKDVGKPEVESSFTTLANARPVSPATHRQALNALLYLQMQVLGQDLTLMQSLGDHPSARVFLLF